MSTPRADEEDTIWRCPMEKSRFLSDRNATPADGRDLRKTAPSPLAGRRWRGQGPQPARVGARSAALEAVDRAQHLRSAVRPSGRLRVVSPDRIRAAARCWPASPDRDRRPPSRRRRRASRAVAPAMLLAKPRSRPAGCEARRPQRPSAADGCDGRPP
jgi:hypothetical protein